MRVESGEERRKKRGRRREKGEGRGEGRRGERRGELERQKASVYSTEAQGDASSGHQVDARPSEASEMQPEVAISDTGQPTVAVRRAARPRRLAVITREA